MCDTVSSGQESRRGRNRVRASVAGLFALGALGCSDSLPPSGYVSIRIEPREVLVAVGATVPIAIDIRGVRGDGSSDVLSSADVALSIADTSYAVIKRDSVSGRLFGSTYLIGELRRGTSRGPRDSVPVFVFRVG